MEKYKETLSNILDIPKGVLLNLPKIMMVGDIQLYIENHQGIIEYTEKKVRLKTVLGELAIGGDSLMLRGIGREEIYIEGQIREVRFVG